MAQILYPIGEQSFREIRRKGMLYVDKTAYIRKLETEGKYYFLSRPRRFGKSLLISTMEEYFRGNRELFRGLAIDRLVPEEWDRYPVFHLDFMRSGISRTQDLLDALSDALDIWEDEYGISNRGESADRRFKKVIMTAYRVTGRQAVVLIDEYDRPIIDVSQSADTEETNRKILHDFYGVMKGCSDYLKFVFLTGVGKLGQINVFSGLNNIADISLVPDYSAICGITTDEMLSVFGEGIADLGQHEGWSFDEAVQQLKDNYDGYHFSRDMKDVYNPFSLIKALHFRDLGDYWFQSGTPMRLVKQFIDNDWGTPDLEGTVVSQSTLEAGDVLGKNLPLACYYTGYLTIKSYDAKRRSFTLGYTNKEVRMGFFNFLLQYIQGRNSGRAENFVDSLRNYIERDDIEGFLRELQSFLAGIPYMNYTDKES